MRSLYVFRQMKSLEDDAYSFGYILLEAVVGASISARREAFLLQDMVVEAIIMSFYIPHLFDMTM